MDFGDLFSGWDWGKIAQGFAGSVPGAITGYMGANQVANANQRAAQIAQQNAAANRQVLTQASAPALQYLQTVMATDPYKLTPQQQITLEDSRRQMVSATPAGLRGSGRFLTAAVNDVNNRGRAGFIDSNIRRADTSAVEQGKIAGGLARSITGENTQAAQATGNAITGTATSNARTLGDIGSYFANAVKDSNRDNRYRDFKGSFTLVPNN